MTPPAQVKRLIELQSVETTTSGGSVSVELPNLRSTRAVYFRISPDYISRVKLITYDMTVRTDIPGTLLDCEVLGRHIYSVFRPACPIQTHMDGSQRVELSFTLAGPDYVPRVMNVIFEFERTELLEVLPEQPVTQGAVRPLKIRSVIFGAFRRKAP